MYKTGFIGCGNMGGALCRAVVRSKGSENIFISDANSEKKKELSKELGVKGATNAEIAQECKYIFLGVKPQMIEEMLGEISDVFKNRSDRVVLVSMAAGVSTQAVASLAGESIPIIRIMPNTPCAVGKGMILYSPNSLVTEEEENEFKALMAQAGKIDKIPESLIDAASAVTGCGPAFVYLFIEALADGGVYCGLPRDKALCYAAQMVCGAAETVLQTKKNPGELKDAVCSPGGTTIAGVRALEEGGFRASAMESVIKAYEKTLKLKK